MSIRNTDEDPIFGDFEPVEIGTGTGRWRWPRTRVALMLVILAAALVGSGWLVLSQLGGIALLASDTSGCRPFTWGICSELSVTEVESMTGVALPPGTEVVSSAYTVVFVATTIEAVLVLPPGESLVVPQNFEIAPDALNDQTALELLTRVDVETLDSAYNVNKSTNRQVFTAHSDHRNFVVITSRE